MRRRCRSTGRSDYVLRHLRAGAGRHLLRKPPSLRTRPRPTFRLRFRRSWTCRQTIYSELKGHVIKSLGTVGIQIGFITGEWTCERIGRDDPLFSVRTAGH